MLSLRALSRQVLVAKDRVMEEESSKVENIRVMEEQNGEVANDRVMEEQSSEALSQKPTISEVFKGRSCFITGATGFLGKVLLEKLLRACDVKHIYVLIRAKKSEDAKQRLDSLLSSKAFDNLRRDHPSSLLKVIPVEGDITRPELGLSDDNQNLLQSVSFVFHCAASIRFDGQCRTAISVNLSGTKNLLSLCESWNNLMGFVHVSTAYSFCNWPKIYEEIYPDVVRPDGLLSLLEWMGDREINEVCQKISRRPSAYHFTKAMAEILIAKEVERNKMPVAIVRPSIITAAWKEPFPGWVDTYYGPNGLIVACGKGVVRTVYAHPQITADFVPVDVVANTLIAAARHLVLTRPSIYIVNCTTPINNTISWGDVERIFHPLILKYPSIDVIRRPGGSFKSSYCKHRLSMILDHWIPALLVDFFTGSFYTRGAMCKHYMRLHRRMSHLEFFTTHPIIFYSPNLLRIIAQMSEKDKEAFPIDMSDLNWDEYFDAYVLGLRRYLLKEDDETLPLARKKMERSYWIWMGVKAGTFVAASMCLRFFPNSLRSLTENVCCMLNRIAKRIWTVVGKPKLALISAR